MHRSMLSFRTATGPLAACLLSVSLSVQAIPITLDANGTMFGAELLSGTRNIGVIFYHGRGQNRVTGDVVRHLQTSLNAEGYTTLSLQNPVPAGGTAFGNYDTQENIIDDQVFARLNAALTEMTNQGVEHVVLSGFSLGSRFMTASAAAWESGIFAPTTDINLIGLVGVGMYSNFTLSAPTSANPTTLDDFNVLDTHSNLAFIDSIPVLDLFGSNDDQSVMNAGIRRNAYAGNPGLYVQTQVACPPNDGTYYARVGNVFEPYYGAGGTDENRCHQLRNGWLPDGNGGFVESFIVRNDASAPLESAVSNFFNQYIVPRTSVPEPGSLLLMLTGLPLLFLLRRGRLA